MHRLNVDGEEVVLDLSLSGYATVRVVLLDDTAGRRRHESTLAGAVRVVDLGAVDELLLDLELVSALLSAVASDRDGEEAGLLTVLLQTVVNSTATGRLQLHVVGRQESALVGALIAVDGGRSERPAGLTRSGH